MKKKFLNIKMIKLIRIKVIPKIEFQMRYKPQQVLMLVK